MPSIMSMPAELAIMIVENVVSLGDLSAIGRTCRRYHDIADPVLYQRALADSDWEVDLLLWAIERKCPQTLAKALSAGFNPDIVVEIPLSHREWKRGETRFWRQSRQRIDARSHSVVPRLDLNFTSTYDADIENHDRYQPAPVRGVPEITPEDRAGMEDRASDQWANEINDAHPRRINRSQPDPMRQVVVSSMPLHVAAQEGLTEMIELLLGTQPSRDQIDQLPMGCCSCYSPASLTETLENVVENCNLMEGGELNVVPTALHLAVCHGHYESAKWLILHGANVFDGGFSPFHTAAASGQEDILRLIVERLNKAYARPDQPLSALVNWRDQNELTPLYHAVANGHWDTAVPYLIAQGADPNPEVSYKLYDLDSGPPPDNTSNGTPSRDEYGVVISLFAELCRVGRFEDASKLFDRMDASAIKNLTGPRVSKNPDPSDDPPSSTDPDSTSFVIPLLHICCMQPLRDSRRIFLPIDDMPLEDMRERWRPVILKKLIATVGLDVNSPWGLGEDPESTPLMVAARHGCLTAIKALLDLGANVRIRNQQGRNPAMLAMIQRARYDSSVSSDHDARPTMDVSDPEFTEMPFLTSSMTRIPLCQLISVLDLLVASGIPVNEEDREGMTALHFFFHGRPPQRFVPVYKHTVPENRRYHLLDNRYRRLSPEEGRLLKYVLNRGADPTVNAGVRDRSVLWTVFAGPWSSACGVLLSSRFGPDIIRFFENNPDQLRDMFLHVVEQHAAANPWPAVLIESFVESLERLLDMDHSERLTYDTRLLFQLLATKRKNANASRRAARCLAQRMVDSGRLEFKTPSQATTLFQFAVSRSAWHLASKLISHVDLACEGPATIAVISSLASTVVPGPFSGPPRMQREVGLWDFITRVVDAGFDVHWRPRADDKIHVEYLALRKAGYQTKSILSWAIFRRWAPLVEFMLNRQPIRESATAAKSTYLHEVFSAHVMFKPWSQPGLTGYNYRPTSNDPKGHKQDVRILNRIIGTLLASGADTTAKNSEGQLPIDVLKAGILESQQEEPNPYSIWFERLTRHLNDSDESIANLNGSSQVAAEYYDETSSESESESERKSAPKA
ncbi:hypothetical protein QBC37DRAFT_157901 [Rhypophila decipiens]|uniref:Uncharacterized protein n=1 Tax=Rhypophila decipiens TaxID=261697 RepID=A0AAN6Y7P9_9PEZI|nr:hypothetical protein QBC37DRAFT_157901 [Rhypophila decipiens]